MNEEQIKGAIRNCLKALEAGDATQFLSFLSADAAWVTPYGTFKGSAEIKNYVSWLNKVIKDFKIIETGIGAIAQGNTGIVEHNLTGTTDGKKFVFPSMCVYEFKDGKVAVIRTLFDRLCLAEQAANGFIAKWMVNAVVKETQKGLR